MHPRMGGGIEGSESGERQGHVWQRTVAKIKQDGIAAGRQVGSRRELREKTNHEVDSATEIADLARGRVSCSPECHVFCSERFGGLGSSRGKISLSIIGLGFGVMFSVLVLRRAQDFSGQ